ncbi:MAG: hypothetical protein ACE5E5_13975 [Phycisphaerae bacterium]
MKSKVCGLALAVVLGLYSANAVACPKNCGSKKSATTVAKKDAAAEKGAAKPGCHGNKAATTVAVKDEAKATTKVAKKGCCAKKGATTVAKKDDTKAATKVAKKGCCAKKGAKVAAAKAGCRKKCGMRGKTVAAKDGGCPIAKKCDTLLASMPHMTFQVGDETTDCPKAAAAMAEEAKKPIAYVVADEKFDNEAKATVKLASLLDAELEKIGTVQYSVKGKCTACPMTAKSMAKKAGAKMMYRVAGWDFADRAAADKAAKAATEAASKVAMEYKVGDETFGCPKKAGARTAESGKTMTYVVGDEETCCSTQAKILVVRAKARAMVQAAASLTSL